MKKIYYFMLAMTACLLSSCFDDDGNYTYTEVPEISISGLGETHVLNSYSGEMLEIDPVIESDYTDLTYEWYMWSLTKEQEGSTGAGEAVGTELISTDKKLSWEVACPIGYYRIMLKVTSPFKRLFRNSHYPTGSSNHVYTRFLHFEGNGRRKYGNRHV